MYTAYLGIGTNLGDKKLNISTCFNLLKQKGIIIEKSSSIYQTQPWGGVEQDDYYNLVLSVRSPYFPLHLLKITQEIESEMGRIKKVRWGERIIDIDILLFESYQFHTVDLIIPHIQIPFRNFVLKPLSEIAPSFTHPTIRKSIKELEENCTDTKWILKI